MQVSLTGYQCLRCGHQWRPRGTAPPERCPKCESRKWQIPPGEELPPYLAEVFQLYEVPQDQRADIIRYAFQHPGVAQALKEAVPELEKRFGEARRRLDLFRFYDNPGEEELLGLVLFKEYPEDAGLLMEPFDKAFWSKVPREIRFHLSFQIEMEDAFPV